MGKNIDNRSHLNKEPDSSLSGFLALKTQEFSSCFTAYKDLALKIDSSTPEFFQKMRSFIANTLSIPEDSKEYEAVLNDVTKSFINKVFNSSDGSLFFIDEVHADANANDATHQEDLVYLTSKDVEIFDRLTSQDPNVSQYLRRLLLALMMYYRRNFHPSGWVRYAREEIFFLAGLAALPTKSKEELTQHLFKEYGFSLRVIGSNSPIPCYMIDWLFEQAPSEPFPIGPYLPSTIDTFLLNHILITSPKKEEKEEN